MNESGRAFRGDRYFLSNMYPCTITLPVNDEKLTFTSSEAAFQAGKCVKQSDVLLLADCKDGYEAKRVGRKVLMSDNWDKDRIVWMHRVLLAKFEDPELQAMLLATGDEELVEHNTHGDTFWGICGGKGRNQLGQILMDVRSHYQYLKKKASSEE